MKSTDWWKTPEDNEEYHTSYVWELIANAAEKAGDRNRALEARNAAEMEARNCGAE